MTPLVIVIPTYGRRDTVTETVARLLPLLPEGAKIVVATCRIEDRPIHSDSRCNYVLSRQGSALQRNAALDHITSMGNLPEVVLFLDDDIVPCPTLLTEILVHHRMHPEAAGFACNIIADGATCGGIDLAQAEKLASAWTFDDHDRNFIGATSGYVGFSIRGDLVPVLRFDERLAGYGFMEDWDYFFRVRAFGPTGMAIGAGLVHLAAVSGRTSHEKLGFGQITNPLYLAQKGTLPWRDAIRHVTCAIGANFFRFCEPSRRRRLVGNFYAMRELLLHGPCPERVEVVTIDLKR